MLKLGIFFELYSQNATRRHQQRPTNFCFMPSEFRVLRLDTTQCLNSLLPVVRTATNPILHYIQAVGAKGHYI